MHSSISSTSPTLPKCLPGLWWMLVGFMSKIRPHPSLAFPPAFSKIIAMGKH